MIPQGTKVRVRSTSPPRPGRGPSTGKAYMTCDLEVVEPAQYKGMSVSLTLWIDPTSAAFRSQVQVITGINVSAGATMTMTDLEDGLRDYDFFVTVGEDRADPTKNVVKYLEQRLERDAVIEEIPATRADEVLSRIDDLLVEIEELQKSLGPQVVLPETPAEPQGDTVDLDDFISWQDELENYKDDLIDLF